MRIPKLKPRRAPIGQTPARKSAVKKAVSGQSAPKLTPHNTTAPFKGISVKKKVDVKLGAHNNVKPSATSLANGQTAPKLTRQNAMIPNKGSRTDISTNGQLGLGATATASAPVKPVVKPEAPATPSASEVPKRSLMDKILGRNKAATPATTTAAAAQPDAADVKPEGKTQSVLSSFASGLVDEEPETGGGFLSSIAGSLVGTAALTIIPTLFAGGGGQAEQAPPPAPPAQQPQSPDPYAVGSYGVPGSLPNYI